MTMSQVIVELADPASPIRQTGLVQLSGLSRAEVADVMASWKGIVEERRRELLDRMNELTVDNIELDFFPVFRACLRDSDAGVRSRAARALIDSDDRTNIRPLAGLLATDPSPAVRAAAATTLGRFVEMAEEGKLIRRDGQRIGDALVAVIEDPDEDVETRLRAIEAVSPIPSDRIRAIIDRAYNDDDIRLKRSAIYAMGRSSDASWLPTVLLNTRHPDAAIRYEAAAACGFLGEEDTVPHLMSLLNDDDTQVQLSAVRSLGLIGGDLARRALIQALRRGDDAIEEVAEEALASLVFDEDPLGFRIEG